MVGYTSHQLVSRKIGKNGITEGHSVRSHLEAVSRLNTALVLTAAHLMSILYIHFNNLLVALEGDNTHVGLHLFAEGDTDGGVCRQVGLVVLGIDEQNVRLDGI